MFESLTPAGLASMPTLFRLTALSRTPLVGQGYRMEAALYHDRASLGVTWTVKQPDTRLKEGVLVSPRYLNASAVEGGLLRIVRLVLIENPIRTENLFCTVPPAWVEDRELVQRAGMLYEALDLPYQELFNGVLWDAEVFHGHCIAPSSLQGHHSERNGNFRHMVEVGEAILALLPQHPAADSQISLAAGLLHDVGKPAEYETTSTGWVMSDEGILNGHKQMIGDLIAVAKKQMRLALPKEHYVSLRHAIGAAKGVPFESGYREPKTPEARLLSLADQSSGSGDLYARQAAANGGWGRRHSHLGGEAPYTVVKASPEAPNPTAP